jgi:hypothetical protein
MEDRSSTRHNVEIPVYARTHSGAVSSPGCLLSVSLTGGFLLTTVPARPHSHISLRLIGSDGELSHRLEGEVVWRSFAGVGIVWSEPATELIRTLGLTSESYDFSTSFTAAGS